MNSINFREFQPGLVYVFTTKRYLKDMKYTSATKGGWAKRANGHIVKVEGKFEGTTIRGYSVSPDWCKCIGKE